MSLAYVSCSLRLRLHKVFCESRLCLRKMVHEGLLCRRMPCSCSVRLQRLSGSPSGPSPSPSTHARISQKKRSLIQSLRAGVRGPLRKARSGAYHLWSSALVLTRPSMGFALDSAGLAMIFKTLWGLEFVFGREEFSMCCALWNYCVMCNHG